MKLLLVFSLNFVCIVFCKAHFELNASYISIEKLNKNKYSDNHDSLLIVYDRLCDKILSNSLELEHYDTLIFFINNFPDEGLNEGFGEYLYNLFLNNEANNLQFRLILIKHNMQFRKNTQLNLLSLLWLNLQENNTSYEQFLKQFSLFDSFFRLKKEYNKRYIWFSSSP
jgi:hypothetical protein